MLHAFYAIGTAQRARPGSARAPRRGGGAASLPAHPLAHRNASTPIARVNRSQARKGTGARQRMPGHTHTGHDSPTKLVRSLHDNDRTSGGMPNQHPRPTYIVGLSRTAPYHCPLLLLLSPNLTMSPRLSGIDGNISPPPTSSWPP